MAGFCIAAWEKGVLQYCLLAGNCIAIQLCHAGLCRQGLYRNTVQNIVIGDKGKGLGCVAIQHSQPRTRRCSARSKARGAQAWRAHTPTIRQPCAATRPAGPVTQPTGRPRYGAGRAAGASAGALGHGRKRAGRVGGTRPRYGLVLATIQPALATTRPGQCATLRPLAHPGCTWGAQLGQFRCFVHLTRFSTWFFDSVLFLSH